jgi:exocyst complex component 2
MFLSEVHNRASTDDLLRGLDFLSQSIEKKSASLKVLVESNFERFVRAKSTIDTVYKEMREHGQEPERPKSPGSHSRTHSRQLSRNSVHFRRTSGNAPFSPTLTVDKSFNPKRKNALVKESEYGVQPIKVPLLELSAKAEEIWGPALGGREKEESLKAVLTCVEKNRPLFELGSSIRDAIKRRDHSALVEDYKTARDYADRAKTVVDNAVASRVPLSDVDVHQVIVTARMWADVEEQIDNFKREVWRKLAGTHFSRQATETESKPEEHMELIGILLELGVEDNPINIWLVSRYDFLKNKIDGVFERMKVEVEILRRRLSNGDKPTTRQMASYLRSVTADGKLSKTDGIDSPRVIEVWEHIQSMLNAILSTQGGILGELIEFWETAQGFIEGRTQRSLPVGIDGSSRKHHRLSTDGVKHLTSGALELITKVREELRVFFSEPPPDDLSLLLSPVPPTPDSPMTPNPNTLSPVFNKFDPGSIPPPSPRRGESWEKYGFWPPYATSISGSYYLSKFLTLIGTASCEMAALSVIKAGRSNMEDIKKMLGEIRERCLSATLAAWAFDSENCKMLEDWTRSQDRHDLTNMPSRFRGFQGFLLTNLQQIMYISEATRHADSPEVIVPPSTKLLQSVRSQFVTSIYRALRGMVQNAENPDNGDESWDADADGLAVREQPDETVNGTSAHLDSSNKVCPPSLMMDNQTNILRKSASSSRLATCKTCAMISSHI